MCNGPGKNLRTNVGGGGGWFGGKGHKGKK